MLISQLEVCQEGVSRMGVLGGHWGFLIRDRADMVIPDIMNDIFYPREDTLKILCYVGGWAGGWFLLRLRIGWADQFYSPQNLWSGTLNVLQVPPFLTPPSWHTSNKDINMKFSGYLHWGTKTSFMTSGMTMSSMSPIRNPQCHPSTPLLDTSNWDNIMKLGSPSPTPAFALPHPQARQPL